MAGADIAKYVSVLNILLAAHNLPTMSVPADLLQPLITTTTIAQPVQTPSLGATAATTAPITASTTTTTVTPTVTETTSGPTTSTPQAPAHHQAMATSTPSPCQPKKKTKIVSPAVTPRKRKPFDVLPAQWNFAATIPPSLAPPQQTPEPPTDWDADRAMEINFIDPELLSPGKIDRGKPCYCLFIPHEENFNGNSNSRKTLALKCNQIISNRNRTKFPEPMFVHYSTVERFIDLTILKSNFIDPIFKSDKLKQIDFSSATEDPEGTPIPELGCGFFNRRFNLTQP